MKLRPHLILVLAMCFAVQVPAKAIIFVVDHSFSMMGMGNTYPGRDPLANRFVATSDMIDSIYAHDPQTEVGIVVFREVLFFDTGNNGHVTVLDTGRAGYYPLKALSSIVNDSTWSQVMKRMLRVEAKVGRNVMHNIDVNYSDLVYQPQFATLGNTNINTAFDAVRKSFAHTTVGKEDQFVVFVSDGEPFPVGALEDDAFGFVRGTNMPTTFTVYLDTILPLSLANMSTNIRNNGYSVSNALSSATTTTADLGSLTILLRSIVIDTILKKN